MKRVGLVAMFATWLTGCLQLDVAQPIALVPADSWHENTRLAIGLAAECWNMQFGTQLQLGLDDSTAQRVEIGFDELVCSHDPGLTRIGSDVAVWICPPQLLSGRWFRGGADARFRNVITHELGHVLNIREHAVRGVMGPGGSSAFSDEDLKLFFAANPDFTHSGSCPKGVSYSSWKEPCGCF